MSIPTGYLGWSVALTALTLGLAASGIVAVIILATRPHRRGAELALGPYLLFGALAAAVVTG